MGSSKKGSRQCCMRMGREKRKMLKKETKKRDYNIWEKIPKCEVMDRKWVSGMPLGKPKQRHKNVKSHNTEFFVNTINPFKLFINRVPWALTQNDKWKV